MIHSKNEGAAMVMHPSGSAFPIAENYILVV